MGLKRLSISLVHDYSTHRKWGQNNRRIIYEDHLERGMAKGSQEEGSSGVADLNDAP